MFITGWVFACAGGFIRVACHRALGRFFTWDLSVQKDHTLITSGPYSVVRHPGYTGLSLIAMGNILCSCSAGSYWTESGFSGSTFGRLFVPAWVLYWVVIPFFLCARVNEEDRVLREKFGGEWDAWARRTKYKLIPFVY
ncbi:putative protein-S-isoprenylcysteine O-methyltransferase [Grifola frondosa]|uniref:Protein-S-isoprenylcysteine O-methyltransferase n=1 Tax=Grifola frondosa TaxID=5627 RepID=A0A1C7MG27_GRIFR|nr:putative protein-S-isoprenylcysteine O-methyltransferase [Grifola frondosa]